MMKTEGIKTAFAESCICRLYRVFAGAYEYSRLKRCADAISRCFENSAIGSGFKRFTNKRPRYQYSVYQKTLNGISDVVSGITLGLRAFFLRIMSGSVLCGVYFGFVNNELGNKLRAAGVFGFYFFLIASMLGLFQVIGLRRALPSFVLALVFFVLAFFADKLAAALKNSFFAKLILGLIK